MIKWEEKKCIEQKKSCLNNSEQEETAIIKNTLKKSKNKECKNIGWTRNCPMCNKVIQYKSSSNFCRAKRKNYRCVECGKKFSGAKTGRVVSQETRDKKSKAMKGKKFPPEFGEAVRKRMMGNKNSKGKPKPLRWKQALIDKMSKNYQEPYNIGKAFLPNYNKDACEYFDWLNKFMGWDGQYATFRGEKNVLSYFVDYYEPNLNLVIEWDEAHHKKQIAEDKKRQEDIKQHLGCRFFRYDVLTSSLKEV